MSNTKKNETKVPQEVAGEMIGRSRATIVRACSEGKLSKAANGRIDISELTRYAQANDLSIVCDPEEARKRLKEKKNGGGELQDQEQAPYAAQAEIDLLKERLQMKDQLLADREDRIKELAAERDDYKEEARTAKERETRLLTDQRDKEKAWQDVIGTVAELKANQDKMQAEQSRGFFDKLFGRKKA